MSDKEALPYEDDVLWPMLATAPTPHKPLRQERLRKIAKHQPPEENPGDQEAAARHRVAHSSARFRAGLAPASIMGAVLPVAGLLARDPDGRRRIDWALLTWAQPECRPLHSHFALFNNRLRRHLELSGNSESTKKMGGLKRRQLGSEGEALLSQLGPKRSGYVGLDDIEGISLAPCRARPSCLPS